MLLRCNNLILLLPALYQKHLASSRVYNLAEIIETIRRLEAIFDAQDNKPYNFNSLPNNRNRQNDIPPRPQRVSEVQVEVTDTNQDIHPSVPPERDSVSRPEGSPSECGRGSYNRTGGGSRYRRGHRNRSYRYPDLGRRRREVDDFN